MRVTVDWVAPGDVPKRTLYPAKFVKGEPSMFWLGAHQLNLADSAMAPVEPVSTAMQRAVDNKINFEKVFIEFMKCSLPMQFTI